jgi:hypothetical protein
VKEIQSKDQLEDVINKLKESDMYDDGHPYFVKDSPFYLSTTEDSYLEVNET